MTRIHLRRILIGVIFVYALALALAVLLRRPFADAPSGYYSAYKDLIPLVIAIPAYLAFAFQRRGSYLQALRTVWEHMVGAVAGALTYTETDAPSQELQLQTMGKLSVVIEEVRGVFRNVPAPGAPEGWYPFEPVKQIYRRSAAPGRTGVASFAEHGFRPPSSGVSRSGPSSVLPSP
jgi:hypothetical protein